MLAQKHFYYHHCQGVNSFVAIFLTGAYVTDQGLIEGCANELKKLQKQLSFELKSSNQLIFADVHCKHASPLTNRDIVLDALDTFERGCADAIIITGERTGVEPNLSELKKLKTKNLHPIIIGSGINKENISKYLDYSDGVIIGTACKENNIISNPVDKNMVKILMEKVKQFKET